MQAQPGVTNMVAFKSVCSDLVNAIESHQRFRYFVFNSAAEAEARRRILVTAIALERYHNKHGAYPVSLDLLAPEFLKTVPVDFMDGRPLRYRLTGDGHFVLYSVGLDCVDDGGKQPLPDAPRMPRNSEGFHVAPTNVDIVWPRPAASRTPANRP